MFFLIERREELALHPKHYGKNLREHILAALRLKVEGKCSGRYGYTIAVTNMEDPGEGKLHEDTGFAHFNITYLALVFRPFRNEILSAKVTTVNNNGFFASAGPLEIFVSEKLMPVDLKYDAGKDGLPQYYSEEENVRIEQGSEVRIKIAGIRMATDQIVLIGTIKEDFLG